MKKVTRVGATLLAGSSLAWIATPANAQAAQQPAAANPAPDAEAIIVTGSRVVKNGNEMPTPVTVVSTEQIMQVQPTTISQALNSLPQFGGSQTATSGPGSGIRNGAAAFITLRNAGDNHTLVLYDGHRILPASPQESHASDVDLNLIPSILIQRVDIVTGGASAVYGSDAVSGVVNLITDTNFNGVKLQASRGISTYGDDPTTDAALAIGKKIFNDRGHVELSYEFRNDAGVDGPSKLERPVFARILGGSGLGTAASPFTLIEQSRLSNTSFGGKITSATGALASLANLNFTSDNSLLPFINGASVTGNANVQSGGDGAYYYNSTLKASNRFHRLFGRFDYELSDTVKAYVQGVYTHQISKNYFQTSNLSFNVGLDNPFLDTVAVNTPAMNTAQFQALRTANPTGTFRMTEFLLNQEASRPVINTMGFGMILAGLKGKLGSFDWQLRGAHEWAIQKIENTGNLDVGKFLAAVDTVRVGGAIVCRASQTNSAYAGCVPFNPFGPTAASQAALNYVSTDTTAFTYTKLDEIQGEISGDLFNTWAGPVSAALSSEWHRSTFRITSNGGPNDTVDCAGLRFGTLTGSAVTGNCNGPNTNNPTLRWAQNTLTALNPVAIEVFEGAAEAEVPLLKDVPFARDVSANLAARYTHYSTSGDTYSWKAGLTWKVSDDIRLRFSRSHDIRAPNFNELYSPPAVNIVQNFTDPTTATAASPNGTVSYSVVPRTQFSSISLKPEKANTWTIGAVITPRFAPGLSLSVDAWWLKMTDTIFQVRGTDGPVASICANSVVAGKPSPYCDLYVHNSSGTLTGVLGNVQNIASQKTNGVDMELNYTTRIHDQPFNFRTFAVWQPKNTFDTGPGGIVETAGSYAGQPAGVAASPKWRITAIATYNLTDGFRVSVMERWRSSLNGNAIVTPLAGQPAPNTVYANGYVPPVAYTNLTLSWTVPRSNGQFEFYGNVQNLFNKFSTVELGGGPTTVPGRGINPLPIGDDPIGRYFQVGARLKF